MAQETAIVKGHIVDNNNKPISYAFVQLSPLNFSLTNPFSNSISSMDGFFQFSFDYAVVDGSLKNLSKKADTIHISPKGPDLKQKKLLILIYAMGYQLYSDTIVMESKVIDIGYIHLNIDPYKLREVEIVDYKPAIHAKGDTLEYVVDFYKSANDLHTTEILNKIPGLSYNKGSLSSNGKKINRVTIDGRNVFSESVALSLKSVPLDLVSKIQLIETFSKGVSTKTMNIITTSDSLHEKYGEWSLGYGSHDKWQLQANSHMSFKRMNLDFFSNYNNINTEEFLYENSVNDIIQLANRDESPELGINSLLSSGINLNYSLNNKWNINANYYLSYLNNINKTNTASMSSLPNKDVIETIKYSNLDLIGLGNKLNFSINYRMDANNLFSLNSQNKLTSIKVYDSLSNEFISQTILNNSSFEKSNGEGLKLISSNSLSFNHSSKKMGRSLNFVLGNILGKERLNDSMHYNQNSAFLGFSSREQFLYNSILNNNIFTTSGFTEPLGSLGRAKFSFASKYGTENISTLTDILLNLKDRKRDSLQSVLSDNKLWVYNFGVGVKKHFKYHTLDLGVNYDYSQIYIKRSFPGNASKDVDFTAFLPNLYYQYSASTLNKYRFSYYWQTLTPSSLQMQAFFKLISSQIYISGNPELRNQVSQSISAEYTHTGVSANRLLLVTYTMDLSNNYIGREIFQSNTDAVLGSVKLLKGTQLIKYGNFNGYMRQVLFFDYGFSWMKINLNLKPSFIYFKTPGLINGRNFFNYNTLSNFGFVIYKSIGNLDVFYNHNTSYNYFVNSINMSINKYFSNNHSLEIKVNFFDNIFLTTEMKYINNSNMSSRLLPFHAYIQNASIGYRFSKNKSTTINLSVFDIFDQNKNIIRESLDNYISESSNLVINRYFMLHYSYQFSNNSKKAEK